MKPNNGKFALLLASVGVLCSATISLADQSTSLVSTTQVVSACGELFALDSNADGKTAAERVRIVQNRLDDALISSKFRVAESVSVGVSNRNPVVLIDGKLIVTADGNSATRAGLTQMQLAQKWADSIRMCLSHTAELDKYISMLTGKFQVKATAKTFGNDEIAVAPSEMLFPIELATPISAEASAIGDRVEAVITHDVPLRPSFDTYIQAGALVYGEIVDANQFVPNHFAGKDGISIEFYEIRMPDGKKIPITAHVLGSLNQWRLINIKPTTAEHVQAVSVAVQDNRIVTVELNAKKGVITGGWKGVSVDMDTDRPFHRLVFKRTSGLVVPAGEPMLMQLSGTTTVAISSQTL